MGRLVGLALEVVSSFDLRKHHWHFLANRGLIPHFLYACRRDDGVCTARGEECGHLREEGGLYICRVETNSSAKVVFLDHRSIGNVEPAGRSPHAMAIDAHFARPVHLASILWSLAVDSKHKKCEPGSLIRTNTLTSLM